MMRWVRRALLMAAVLGVAPRVAAEADTVAQAKSYFKASAAAYEMGDYLAAIQALDAAYRLTPLPAIAFSLAQAERRQYFVSHDRAHLERAIELFRGYLQQLTSGGRRADATDALAQLEPLAALGAGATNSQPAAALDKTRLMITCGTPKARVSLDGAAAVAAPLIAQVTPGQHRVVVTATGFFPSQRSVEAIAGEFVPLEVALREQPATVVLRAPREADVHVDGSFVGSAASHERLELPSGTHRFSFTQNGHRIESVEAHLEPGSTHTIAAKLQPTGQRTTALALFIATAASLATGVVFTALAVDRENAAVSILRRRSSENIDGRELDDYVAASRARSLFRVAAIAGFAASAASLITGAFLFALDQPDVAAPPAARSLEVRASLLLPAATLTPGVDVRVRF
jgi:hypothetical protein